jgi:hypothetical protein
MIGAIIVLIVLVVCLLTAFNNDLLYQKQISERIYNNSLYQKQIAEKMYSEEDMINLLMIFGKWYNNNEIIKPRSFILTNDILVFINEQFKKK